MIYGRNIAENHEKMARDLLKTCRQQLSAKQKLRTISELKAEEIEMVKTKFCGDHLPNGWYFDGRQYMNFDGDVVYEHPNLEMLLNGYL